MTTYLLTPSQQRVVLLIMRGLSYRDAARELGLSPRTINNHVRTIADKLYDEPELPPYRKVQRWALLNIK